MFLNCTRFNIDDVVIKLYIKKMTIIIITETSKYDKGLLRKLFKKISILKDI